MEAAAAQRVAQKFAEETFSKMPTEQQQKQQEQQHSWARGSISDGGGMDNGGGDQNGGGGGGGSHLCRVPATLRHAPVDLSQVFWLPEDP
jgi:hypothetical protein